MERTYEVHQALADESNEGWILIRLAPDDKKEKLGKACKPGRRPIVCIKGKNFKPVYAEALYADDTYLNNRKSNPNFHTSSDRLIILSAWYRNLLGVNSLRLIKLNIEPMSPLNLVALLYRYPRDHPQALVRAANMMAIIGFGLGAIGFGLGLVGIHDWLEKYFSTSFTDFSDPIGIVLFVIGFLITLLGIVGLIRRRQ